jgi:nucleoside-diphosphate-sugar epimerase
MIKMSIKKIVVTGGSGKAGRAVVKDLVAHGYEVVNVDVLPSKEDLGVPFVPVDLNKFSEVLEVLKGQDAVVHLAAIPAPGIKSEEETFSNNILSTYNVFQVRARTILIEICSMIHS